MLNPKDVTLEGKSCSSPPLLFGGGNGLPVCVDKVRKVNIAKEGEEDA